MIIYLIIAAILLGLYEFIPLKRKNMRKEAIFVSVILTLSLITIASDEMELPSFMEVLYEIISPITKLVFKEQ